MSTPENLKKIQDDYQKHGGDTEFQKLLVKFKSNYSTEIAFLKSRYPKNIVTNYYHLQKMPIL